jgi:arsenite/tail-anchored protein-transporting ATPase
MIDALLSRASTKFIFVVGKGGVGKTTTAGAIALAFADRGQRTHLISTDPAHSLRDLFNDETCSSQLSIEEFDARQHADVLFAKLRGPLIELIERGTYLDAGDARSFLDLSIPGIDEVMAALRLAELDNEAIDHIVVDTAPTGHTIRLLDAGRIIDSWVAAGLAMAEKAGVVASAMVGRRIPLEAEPLLDEWRNAAHRFYDDVLKHASAIVVTRPGKVVAAETARLVNDLQKRNVRLAAVVSVTGDSVRSDFTVAKFTGAQGCNGVRQWATQLSKSES